jgi:hypothetical protein
MAGMRLCARKRRRALRPMRRWASRQARLPPRTWESHPQRKTEGRATRKTAAKRKVVAASGRPRLYLA